MAPMLYLWMEPHKDSIAPIRAAGSTQDCSVAAHPANPSDVGQTKVVEL